MACMRQKEYTERRPIGGIFFKILDFKIENQIKYNWVRVCVVVASNQAANGLESQSSKACINCMKILFEAHEFCRSSEWYWSSLNLNDDHILVLHTYYSNSCVVLSSYLYIQCS